MNFLFKKNWVGLFVLSPIELVLESRVDGWFGLSGYRRAIMHHVIHCFKNSCILEVGTK